MKTSVIVVTYNAPRLLDLVLCGMSRQTRLPDELLIADDGSTEETAELLAAWRGQLTMPLQHVWHVDRGYRKSRIINEAVRRSTGDHLIFLDGDAIPHSRWVDDHLTAADGKHVLCGRRVRLGPELTAKLTRDTVLDGTLESLTGPVASSWLRGDTKRFLLGVRLPAFLARAFHPRPRKLMGVNFSLPRHVFEAVNGYDQAYTVAWREDYDLELRIKRGGYPFRALLNRAVVYHMYHEERSFDAAVEAIHTAHEKATNIRCDVGLEGQAFNPQE